MQVTHRSYYFLAIASATLFILTLAFQTFAPSYLVSENLLLIVPIYFVVTLLSRIILSFVSKKSPSQVKIYYLLLSSGKFFLYIGILIAYGIFNREDVPAFFLSFLVFYLIYLFLDVRFWMSLSSK